MAKTLYYRINYVELHQKQPADVDAFLFVGSVRTNTFKYDIWAGFGDPGENPLFDSSDYPEFEIVAVTFSKPSNFTTAKGTYFTESIGGGLTTPHNYDLWGSVSVPDNFKIPAEFALLPSDIFKAKTENNTDATYTHSNFYLVAHETTAFEAFQTILGADGFSFDNILTALFGNQIANNILNAGSVKNALQNIADDGFAIIETVTSDPDSIDVAELEQRLDQYEESVQDNLRSVLTDLLRTMFPGDNPEILVNLPGITITAGFDVREAAAQLILDRLILNAHNIQDVTTEGSPDVKAGIHYTSGKYLTSSNDDVVIGSNLLNVQLGNGNDTFATLGGINSAELGAGKDRYIGGDGVDTAIYSNSPAAISVDLATNAVNGGHATGDYISGVENIVGSKFNDSITGSTDNNTLAGGLGNDILRGGLGNDILNGGGGADTFGGTVNQLNGDKITDIDTADRILVHNQVLPASRFQLSPSGANTLLRIDFDGDNVFDAAITLSGVINGQVSATPDGAHTSVKIAVTSKSFTGIGSRSESFDVHTSTAPVVVKGASGNDLVWTGQANDTAFGGLGRDIVIGDNGNDNLFGDDNANTTAGAADQLLGGGGHDSAYGGPGNDYINGEAGNDKLYGGSGNDYMLGGFGADILEGGAGNDQLWGGSPTSPNGAWFGGAIILQYDGITGDLIPPKSWTIAGQAQSTDASNDILRGGDGNDILNGGAGNDTLNGDAGNDFLTGAAGRDFFRGGVGADRFDFNFTSETKKGSSRDQILDFSHRQKDKIDLSGIDANTKKGGNQKFKFIGDDKFSHTPSELRFKSDVVQGDVNGDGKADFEIKVIGSNPVKGDFVL